MKKKYFTIVPDEDVTHFYNGGFKVQKDLKKKEDPKGWIKTKAFHKKKVQTFYAHYEKIDSWNRRGVE